MEFFRVYGRVIGLRRAERGLAIDLAIANVAVAGLQFYEPVLFGQVIDLLSNARNKPVEILWRDALSILALWAAVGLGGIAANMVVSLQADRSLELWAVPATGAPRSLGVISAAGATVVQRGKLLDNTTALAVSLEPPGGSPTGRATGPVLYVGKLRP